MIEALALLPLGTHTHDRLLVSERFKAEKAAYLAEFRHKTAEGLVQARRDHDAAAKQLDRQYGGMLSRC